MTHLHMANDVSRFIGALEFAPDLHDSNDGALEATGKAVTAGPTSAGCGITNPVMCHHIGDDALEMVGKAITAGPTTHYNPITHRCT